MEENLMTADAPMVIVKVQRPLASNEPLDDNCLVYDEAKTHAVQQPVPASVLEAMKQRQGVQAYRAFFKAQYREDVDGWLIGDLVEDAAW